MNGPRDILLVEPFCIGFEHALFNAALAQAFLHAYPEDRCLFHAERSHLEFVSGIMDRTAPDTRGRMVWNEITVAGRAWSKQRQFSRAWTLADSLGRRAGSRTRSLTYTASTEFDLFALQAMLLRRRPEVPHLAVLHGVLRTSLLPSRRKMFQMFRGLRLIFRLPHARGLRFLALGEPILSELRELVPHAGRHFRTIDIPYVWKNHEVPSVPPGRPRHVFGYLGISATSGFDIFLNIVREARRLGIPADFRMVGYVSSADQRSRLENLGVDTPAAALSDEEFTRRGQSITYALWTIQREQYRLTASTSFLEALSIVRPGIHLRNPYLEHYFQRMGDIGYLCDSPEEIVRQMSQICSAFPLERYQQQCHTILRSREIFSPHVVGLHLRAIIAELSEELTT